MLPLCSFTPSGVQEKLDDLYALTDPDLSVQAASVKEDFRSWMENNFILDTEEQTYLDNLDDKAVIRYGDEMSFCFLYRLSVVLVQNPPVTGLDKYVHTHNAIETSASDDGSFVVSGSYTFTILYK
jgi:hypothetical protein